MKKQFIIIGVVIVLIIVGLSGCSTQNNNQNQNNNNVNPERNSFIGVWKTDPIDNYWTLELYSNGTFKRMDGVVGGQYEINDGHLALNYTDEIWVPDEFDYNFSNSNTTLILIKPSANLTVTLFKE
jgi:hypothetical protein